jgi:hypothetical protein
MSPNTSDDASAVNFFILENKVFLDILKLLQSVYLEIDKLIS